MEEAARSRTEETGFSPDPYQLPDHVQVDDDNQSDNQDAASHLPEFNNKRIILQRFTIYNSLTTMYIVGSNAKESLFRILEISKDGQELVILEDKSYFYTRKDMVELINGLNELTEGGIHKIAQGYGLLGLIRFTQGYYLSIITKCSQVAVLGGHFIYHVDETKLIPLDFNYRRPDKYSDEERLLSIFKYLDLGKTFYFSYAYDITNTLQTNFIRHKKLATDYHSKLTARAFDTFETFEHNERFVWNNLLLKPILDNPDVATYEWFQPIIHGFIDQANISIYGKKIYITIIARRSHHFAGARFLKRGVNDRGNVANEIETEQIVSDMLISSFHDPKYGFYNNPRFTSFVQHRGSIPLYWTQDLNRLPKPPIEINLQDPFYRSSAIHFNDLFRRYGLPVIILNLIKTKEKQPRELKLNQHFISCIKYLNQFLPSEHRLQLHGFDMSKHSKKNLDVIGPLQKIARSSIDQTGFFHNGTSLATTKIQQGIIRTNCIDCLDRTNAAQFIICKEALSFQLVSLGLISSSTSLDYDSDLINILTEIFHDHGDTIAVQYGGSNLVNTMDSYRRINQWSSHTRDMLNSIKRIYSNSFMDLIRQEAINLFLGNYKYDPNKPKLWELQNDFYLHNNSFLDDIRVQTSYIHWYNERYLLDRGLNLINDCPDSERERETQRLESYPEYNDNWFNECYVPRKFHSLGSLFQFNMNSNARYFPSNIVADPMKKFDYSPFESRKPLFRTTKSIENLETSKDGAQNLRYLDSCDTIPTKPEGNIAEDDELSVIAAETPNSLPALKHRQLVSSGSHDYSTRNSNKIKNFLATKIERLGYSKNKKEDSSHHSASQRTAESKSTSIYGPDLVDESMNIDVDDLKLYHEHSHILSFSIAPPEKGIKRNDGVYESSAADLKVYSYFSNMLANNCGSHEESFSTNLFQMHRSLRPEDVDIYSEYVGISSDRVFNLTAEDDYFK